MNTANDGMAVSDVRLMLDPFLTANPEASLQSSEHGIVVATPWGDESVGLHLSGPADPVIGMLNHLRLFPSFAAIYHRDIGDMEFIFTVGPLPDDIAGRSFEFQLDGKSYRCEYAAATAELAALAVRLHPVFPPNLSDYRHLLPLNHHLLRDEVNASDGPTMETIAERGEQIVSFFIRGAPEDAFALTDIAHHLNLYMTYYDRASPLIDIVSPPAGDAGGLTHQQLTLPLSRFPSVIKGRRTNEYLQQLWIDAHRSPMVLSFIHCYQIIEYVAFYYVKDDVERSLRRILHTPHASEDHDATVRAVVEVVTAERMDDDAKIDAVIRRVVHPSALWPFVENARTTFCQATEFDGGVQLDPLIHQETTENQWEVSWHPALISRLRMTRNALVHGREKRLGSVIAPTPTNLRKLAPWHELITEIAGQLILYSDV